MSRYLIVGDPHCKPDNLHKINKLFKEVESKGLPVIWLGDLLDTKDIVRAQCLNAYINYFKMSKLEHIVLVGNHDQLSANTNDHALEALKLIKGVTVVDKPMVKGLSLFVPYYRNTEDFRASIKDSTAKYLFMHQDIINMDYGNGHISTEGNTLDDLKTFDLVVSGHYHSYQRKDNLIYLGTPFSHSFGESNQEKFLGIFNDEDGGFCTIRNEFPKHITIHLDLSNLHHFDTNNFDHFRIILKGTREQLYAFDKSQYVGFKIIEECASDVHISALKETQTPEDIYSTWYKEVKQGTDEELLKLGLDVLKSVK